MVDREVVVMVQDAGNVVSVDASRTLRLAIATGLLLGVCMLGVALSMNGSLGGVSELEQAEARTLSPQQVRACPAAQSSGPCWVFKDIGSVMYPVRAGSVSCARALMRGLRALQCLALPCLATSLCSIYWVCARVVAAPALTQIGCTVADAGQGR